jgi:peptidoglycan/LPS O-acetylase OafA/YrhL
MASYGLPAGISAPSRIGYIDGLRALAVIAVIIEHIAQHSNHLDGLAAHIALEGAHGVDLFFVLSGFCLAYPTLEKWRQHGSLDFNLLNFASKRLVRIVPPFYIATALFLVAAICAHLIGRDWLVRLPSLIDVAKSALFLDGNTQLLNGSFWTLMVEFRWYLLFPLLLAVWLKSPRAFVAIGFLSAVVYAFTRARGLDAGTLPGFMSGIAAADIFVGARLGDRLAKRIVRLAPALAIVSLAFGVLAERWATIPGFDGSNVSWAYQPTIIGWQCATFFFVVGIGAHDVTRRLLSASWLVAAGVASYGIYLVHEPIVNAVVTYVKGPLGFVCAFAVALACGFAFWAIAERPFTTGRLRAPLLDRTNRILDRLFAWIEVPGRLRLRSESAAKALPDMPADSAARGRDGFPYSTPGPITARPRRA